MNHEFAFVCVVSCVFTCTFVKPANTRTVARHSEHRGPPVRRILPQEAKGRVASRPRPQFKERFFDYVAGCPEKRDE